MAGIGDSWGTAEELLHPRGPDGRWIHKAGIAKSIFGRVMDFLRNFRPRTFQNRGQATRYLQNIHARSPHPMGRLDHIRLRNDLGHANADLRDGVIDEPSTKRFVEMMDRSATELPDDAILTRVVGVDAFGFTPETAAGTDADNPGIRGMSGKLIADRGYGVTTIGGVQGTPPQGSVRMVVAAKKGTRVIVPSSHPDDPTIFLDRGQPLRVTKVAPDGAGGWTMYVTADESHNGDIPEPIAGPIGEGRKPSAEREAAIKQHFQESQRIQSKRMKVPDENQPEGPSGTPEQQARAEQRGLSPAHQAPAPGQRPVAEPPPPRQTRPSPPGTPPARQEPIHARSIGGQPSPEAGAPQGVPEAPTQPQVDLRQKVREAGIPSPSRGRNRAAWNEAYVGVASGKKDPIDAVRELDADIAALQRGGEGRDQGGLIPGRTPDANREGDINALQQLRDLIAREYGLEEPAPVKKAAPAKKAARKAAPGFTPEQENALIDRAKQFRGHEHNEEEQRIVRQADEILARRRGETPTPAKAPAAKAPAAKKALPPVAKKAPVKKAAPASPERLRSLGIDLSPEQRRDYTDLSTEEQKEYRRFRRQQGQSHEDALQSARDLVGTRNATRAERANAALAKKAAVKKTAPEASGDDLDKMTKAELLAEAEKRGITAPKPSWTKDKIKEAIRQREGAGALEAPPVKKAAKDLLARLNDHDNQLSREQARELIQHSSKAQLQEMAKELNVPRASSLSKEELRREIVEATVGRRLDSIATRGFTGRRPGEGVGLRPGESATEALARERAAKAAVPGAAPGTAAGKITAGRLKPGDRVLVTQSTNGRWVPSTRKTGQTELEITGIERIQHGGFRRSGSRLVLVGRDKDGNEIRVLGYDVGTRGDGVPPHQTFIVAPEAGAAPAKKAAKKAVPDLEEAARTRQAHIDSVKGYGELGAEVDELIDNEASDKALQSRVAARLKVTKIPEADQSEILDAFRTLPRAQAREVLQGKLNGNGVKLTHKAGDVVPIDRPNMLNVDGTGLPGDTTHVVVVRPGYEITMPDGTKVSERARVMPATPDEIQKAERGKKLVPERSVAGDRVQAPIQNEPRKRTFDEAWDAADIRSDKAMQEIRADVSSGKITPEEGVRRMESEVSFNKEDLAELDANLRQPDLTPEQRDRMQAEALKLNDKIKEQEKAAKFMRMYFSKEEPTVEEVKISLDAEGFKALQDATPDSLREAAKELGLNPPKGNTKDEILKDLVHQTAERVARERGLIPKKTAAKKAVKAAKKAAPEAPKVSPDREKLDVRTIGAGIEFDENDKWVQDTLQRTQEAVDADKESLPEIGRRLDESATARMTTAVYEHGSWHAEDRPWQTPEETAAIKAKNQAEYDRVKAEVTKMRELAERLKKMRRPGPKKAVPKAEQPLQRQVDVLEARSINERLEKVHAAKSRAEADQALRDLTMPELRRLGEQIGVKGRSKEDLRSKIVDHFKPESARNVNVEGMDVGELRRRGNHARLMGRDAEADQYIAAAIALEDRSIPKPTRGSGERAQRGEVPRGDDAKAWARSHGYIGGQGGWIYKRDERGHLKPTGIQGWDVFGQRHKQEINKWLVEQSGRGSTGLGVPEPEAPAPSVGGGSLSKRAKDAGIPSPVRTFSGVDPAIAEADRRLKAGESPTDVARYLRERASTVAKADLNEEGRRFRVDLDRSSLQSLRKSNAEYLRRVATHVQQEGKASRPAKKAPVKKALPGANLERDLQILARGTTPEERAGTEAPVKKAAPGRPALRLIQGGGIGQSSREAPELGTGPRTKIKAVPPLMSPKEPLKNSWGGNMSPVHFHEDGIVGMALERMGEARRLDVDGEPLQDVIGKLATRAVRGDISQEQLIQELRQLAGRFPQGSPAQRQLERMVDQLDAPKRAPLDLPDGTPAPLTKLMRALSEIPLSRGGNPRRPGGRRDFSEMEQLQDLVRQARERYPDDMNLAQQRRARWLGTELRTKLLNHRHESEEGKFEIDRAIREAMRELEEMVKEGART